MQTTLPGEVEFEDTGYAFSRKSDDEIKQACRIFQSFNNPLLYAAGKALGNIAFQLKLPIGGFLKKTIYRQFCGGETMNECLDVISDLAGHNISAALQYSVETKSSEEEYNQTALRLISSVKSAANNPHIKVICCKLTGIGSYELFEKLHAKSPLSGHEQGAFDRIRQRMDSLCAAAEKAGASLFFDAEETWMQQPMDDLIDEMMQRYNRKRAIVFNTFQLYCTDRLDFLKTSFRKAIDNNFIPGAKLVRGAYLEQERERAHRKGYPSPIFPDKAATDKAYDDAVEFCINNIENISFCAATHNEHSCRHLARLIDKKNISRDHPHVFFSQLYGMGDHLTYNLAKAGFNSTKLVPYGPVMEAIPYLIRRAEENSSMAGQVGRELQLLRKEMKRRSLI